MATVYILYSLDIDKFYIGSCNNLNERLQEHQNNSYKTGFTNRANDWEIFLEINELNYRQARKIESHIKRMKSKKYIKNLKQYAEIIAKLKSKYN